MRRSRRALSKYLDQGIGYQRGEHRFFGVSAKLFARAGRLTYVSSPAVARVSQLDRVTASEAAGCGFNSRHAHHLFMQFSSMSLTFSHAFHTLLVCKTKAFQK